MPRSQALPTWTKGLQRQVGGRWSGDRHPERETGGLKKGTDDIQKRTWRVSKEATVQREAGERFKKRVDSPKGMWLRRQEP